MHYIPTGGTVKVNSLVSEIGFGSDYIW